MSSLNILCAICSTYFNSSDIIYSTRCGHVFHKSCLFRWLKTSRTCPECRKICHNHNCHQLYVNFVEKSLSDNEPEFEFPKGYEWIYIDRDMDHNDDLSFAFKFGQDEEGNDIYAARGQFQGDLIPAYYVPKKGSVIAPWGFKSHRLIDDIELLDISNDDAEYKWVAAFNGDIPENAFATGHTGMGDILYTARAMHEDRILYGKLHQRYNLAYMPYKELEVSNGTYEILVRIPREKAITSTNVDNIINDTDE
ncbi:uncharacterized protein ACRADG_011033 [Cochliomyia hominivorax]